MRFQSTWHWRRAAQRHKEPKCAILVREEIPGVRKDILGCRVRLYSSPEDEMECKISHLCAVVFNPAYAPGSYLSRDLMETVVYVSERKHSHDTRNCPIEEKKRERTTWGEKRSLPGERSARTCIACVIFWCEQSLFCRKDAKPEENWGGIYTRS